MRTTVLLAVLALPSLVAAQGGDKPDSKPASRPTTTWTGVLDEDAFAALHELKEGQAPKLHGKDIEVGGEKAYLSLPPGGKADAAVLVIHEWWGLNDHIRHWADRLAASGYAALAIDLYRGVVATTRDAALAAMKGVNPDSALKTLRSAHDFLQEDERVAAKKTACIGWCFGGGWSLRLAIAEPNLDAAVIYYGRLIDDPKTLRAIRAPVLGIFGEKDRGIPPEAVANFRTGMEEAGRRVTIHSYPANHAFANPSSARYDHDNATRAWGEVRKFLSWEFATGQFSDRSRKLAYDLPQGWREGRASSMRRVSLKFGGGSEFYVVALRGNGGGLGPNLNRWRSQMGQKALSDDEIAALPKIPILGRAATKIHIRGAFQGMSGERVDDAMMIAAVLEMEGEALFVKMIGPRPEVEKADKVFDLVCGSFR